MTDDAQATPPASPPTGGPPPLPPPPGPLEREIVRLIKLAGPMPVSRYMQLCLAHPEHGYYTTKNPLGREGDFITAPEVSQMFGELLGLWTAQVWKQMGAPQGLKLIELGPGRGTMMMDALRAMRVAPALHQSVEVHLVEINPMLRSKQREVLTGSKTPVFWHNAIDEVPEGPTIVLANEYFDALPVHQAVKQTDGWHERTIELNEDDGFVYGVAPEPIPRFDLLMPSVARAAPLGAVFEWRPHDEVIRLARRLRQSRGAALVIDYGHFRSDAGDTLQAIAKHSFADPLKTPGSADLTAHVDFEALARGAEDGGARVHGPAEQGAFLVRLGIETRAGTLKAKASREIAEDIDTALARLISGGREGMGSLFKVLGLSDPSIAELPGLSDESARMAPKPADDAS
jgi:SAM-dependent MidA family methyltransferase